MASSNQNNYANLSLNQLRITYSRRSDKNERPGRGRTVKYWISRLKQLDTQANQNLQAPAIAPAPAPIPAAPSTSNQLGPPRGASQPSSSTQHQAQQLPQQSGANNVQHGYNQAAPAALNESNQIWLERIADAKEAQSEPRKQPTPRVVEGVEGLRVKIYGNVFAPSAHDNLTALTRILPEIHGEADLILYNLNQLHIKVVAAADIASNGGLLIRTSVEMFGASIHQIFHHQQNLRTMQDRRNEDPLDDDGEIDFFTVLARLRQYDSYDRHGKVVKTASPFRYAKNLLIEIEIDTNTGSPDIDIPTGRFVLANHILYALSTLVPSKSKHVEIRIIERPQPEGRFGHHEPPNWLTLLYPITRFSRLTEDVSMSISTHLGHASDAKIKQDLSNLKPAKGVALPCDAAITAHDLASKARRLYNHGTKSNIDDEVSNMLHVYRLACDKALDLVKLPVEFDEARDVQICRAVSSLLAFREKHIVPIQALAQMKSWDDADSDDEEVADDATEDDNVEDSAAETDAEVDDTGGDDAAEADAEDEEDPEGEDAEEDSD
ncbi:uncharacterized protein CLAFUR5_09171 [Fulvia fulva]|uniref:Uncharacterized protein n=1 Tax=Passalora fulva TaxID=5499 RepID=A0A9Q8UTZ9_PASFU|nr:uncharacterized protein CLAFUR5_09171 [Fulvia fulva]UJO22360.1 hypothetical protein CLAFUR5_09171 [Fulvia fulva]